MNKIYTEWLKKIDDEQLLGELKAIANDETEIENRFYKDLEFGTGGLRGVIGVGTNCLNVYTIRRITAGVAEYIKLIKGNKVAISYDSRINSELFARTSAEVFASYGIKTIIVKELMPTPFLSYITREYKCDMGVMVTASHNPAKYNGYKVYGCDGCQLTDSGAEKISEAIAKIEYFSTKTDHFETYVAAGLIEYVDDAVISKYLTAVRSVSVCEITDLTVAYTPLNGTGYKIIPRMLAERGVDGLHIVESQALPNGNFPTCPYPNPEKREALMEGLKTAEESCADILLATDPDADRVGIAVKHEGEYCLLTGNEVGVLLTDFLFAIRKEYKTLPKSPVLIKTIVTTNLAGEIAAQYNATVINVLTGFKYIGEQIGHLEHKNEQDRFILGFEESYGYLVGTSVRDKDAVVAVQMICEMTSYYKKQGKTLVDVLKALYAKFGRYEHTLFSYQFDGAKGSSKIKMLMNELRENSPEKIAGFKVLSMKDYLLDNGDGLPKSNVLAFEMESKLQLIVRPSGTEPLVKLYLTTCQTEEKNAEIISLIKAYLDEKFV